MLFGVVLSLVVVGHAFSPIRHFKRGDVVTLNLKEFVGGPDAADAKDAIIEISTSRRLVHGSSSMHNERELAFDTVYKEYKEDKVAEVIENPLFRVFGILFNPTSMLVALYLSSIGWSKVLWLQRIFRLFGRGTLVKKPGKESKVPEEDLPFQIFECEVCQLEMRPARGRAEAIFGRPRFRCSRCGSKASAFFDVEDMNDERAVARLKRLDALKHESFSDADGDGSDDYDLNDDDDYDGDDNVDFDDE